MTMLRIFRDAALEVDPDALDEGRTMRYCGPHELAELWTASGLRDVETGTLVISAHYDDVDDYWSPFPAGIAPAGAYCASLNSEQQQTLRDTCFLHLGSPAGPFELTARAWFVSGNI
jgi:hypothetical protein